MDDREQVTLARVLSVRVKLTDEAAAAEVTPEQACAYLAAHGWTETPLPENKWRAWWRGMASLLVPRSAEWPDYGAVLVRIINTLADAEGRSALAVWVDMQKKP